MRLKSKATKYFVVSLCGCLYHLRVLKSCLLFFEMDAKFLFHASNVVVAVFCNFGQRNVLFLFLFTYLVACMYKYFYFSKLNRSLKFIHNRRLENIPYSLIQGYSKHKSKTIPVTP